ncbi:MAG: hypothetical protein ABIB04_00505 [Patescibacteria group bacterium]
MALEIRGNLEEPVHYLEKEVRFSFSKCDTQKYCIQKLEKDELRRFYQTLGYLEKHTWKQTRGLPREKGISLETKNGNIFELLKPKMDDCSTFGHFRVDGTSVNMRIFIGLNKDLAFILLIDREGELQH